MAIYCENCGAHRDDQNRCLCMDRCLTMNHEGREVTEAEREQLRSLISGMAGEERITYKHDHGHDGVIDVELNDTMFVCDIDVIGEWDDWFFTAIRVA